MTPRRYDPEDAEFKQENNFNTKLFEELLPRFDNRYGQNLQGNLMDDCTSIKQTYEKLSTKFSKDVRSNSYTISFHTTSNASQEASFFELKLPMPIFTYIPTKFGSLQIILSNNRFLKNPGEDIRVIPGQVENMPCYTLDFNRVSLSKKGLKGRDPSIQKFSSGIYTKYTHKGRFVTYSSPNILLLGGSISSPVIDDYSKGIIDKCFEYAYWNLPSPKEEKSSRLDNLIFHGGRDIFYHNVFKFNKTLIRILSIDKNHIDSLKILDKTLKFYTAKVSMLVDNGDKIFSEVHKVILTETIADLFKEGEIFTGLILSHNIKPHYNLIFGSLGKKIEPDDLTSLVSLVMHKELQNLNETSSITFVDKLNNLSLTISELIKNNSNNDGVFNSSFQLISDREGSLKNSIENLFPLYLNDNGNIHQLSTTVISFFLSHNSEALKNQKAISLIIKILNTAIVNSNDWSDEARLQLKISNKGSNSLTAPTVSLFVESAPKLAHLMVCSRIFSQKF